MRVALAQLNTVVGDIDGNAARVGRRARARGRGRSRPDPRPRAGADRLSAGGPAAAAGVRARPRARPSRSSPRGCATASALIGFVDWNGECYNAAAVVADGRVQAVYRKRFLPNYGVFDEARYFAAGDGPAGDRGARRAGRRRVCEDIWYPSPVAARPRRRRRRPDLRHLGLALPPRQGRPGGSGCSPPAPTDCAAYLAFCNQVGGQDELVFDGRSAVFDADGELVARAAPFVEDLLVADLDLRGAAPPPAARAPGPAPAAPRGRRGAGRRPRRPQRPPAAARPAASPPPPRRGRGAVGRPACSGCATTSTRTASRAW